VHLGDESLGLRARDVPGALGAQKRGQDSTCDAPGYQSAFRHSVPTTGLLGPQVTLVAQPSSYGSPAVAAFNPAERIKGKTIIRVRP
jgi:hypothetical protein